MENTVSEVQQCSCGEYCKHVDGPLLPATIEFFLPLNKYIPKIKPVRLSTKCRACSDAERLKNGHKLRGGHKRKGIRPEREGIIYFIHAPEVGRIKIGITMKPLGHRLTGLIGQSPCDLEILGWMEGTLSIEKGLHKKFMKHKHHCEWFNACQEILDFIRIHCE